jgi:hypothetical protein
MQGQHTYIHHFEWHHFPFAEKGLVRYSPKIRSCGPTGGDETIELNCYGERGVIQDSSSPAGFDRDTTTNDGLLRAAAAAAAAGNQACRTSYYTTYTDRRSK